MHINVHMHAYMWRPKSSARKRCGLSSKWSKVAIPPYIKSSAVAGNCVKCTEQQQQKLSYAEALPSNNLQKERKRTQVGMLSQTSTFFTENVRVAWNLPEERTLEQRLT